jgi:hypothetical protein
MVIGLALAGLTVARSWLASGQTGSEWLLDIPENHWVFQAISDLKSEGILVGYPDGLGTQVAGRARVELGVATNAACDRLHQIVSGLKGSNDAIAEYGGSAESASSRIRQSEARLKGYLKLLRAGLARTTSELDRLIRFLTPQLTSIGVEPVRLRRRMLRDCAEIRSLRVAALGEATRQFPDVPDGHWAEPAIQTLRSQGILRGYESGTFNLVGSRRQPIGN